MTEERFIRKYSGVWEEFEAVLKAAGKRSSMQDPEFYNRLTSLYQKTSSHLSYARTHFPVSQTCDYLNRLVSKGHGIMYTAPGAKLPLILSFYKHQVPQAIIKNAGYIIAAAVIFIGAILYSWIQTAVDPTNARVFLPENILQNFDPGRAAEGNNSWNSSLMSGMIMVNNVKVALNAFALGITFSIGTVYVLFVNGMLLGSLSCLASVNGSALEYWSLILPHGFIELAAIILCSAAGIKIGLSLLNPGIFSRKDSFVMAAMDGLKIIGIVVPMLITAALIEGFITPSRLHPRIKLIFAACTFIIMLYYFLSPVLHRRQKNVL